MQRAAVAASPSGVSALGTGSARGKRFVALEAKANNRRRFLLKATSCGTLILARQPHHEAGPASTFKDSSTANAHPLSKTREIPCQDPDLRGQNDTDTPELRLAQVPPRARRSDAVGVHDEVITLAQSAIRS
jgi:hypothetical protein